MAIGILVELSQGEDPLSGNQVGILDIQAHMIGSGEHRKIRDEIAGLIPGAGLKGLNYIHLDADSLVAQIGGANVETVRSLEEAGSVVDRRTRW